MRHQAPKKTDTIEMEVPGSGSLRLENHEGGKVGEIYQLIAEPGALFYRRHKEARTFRIGYTVGQGEFILDGIVIESHPKSGRRELSELESLPVVKEIISALVANGHAASSSATEDV